MKLNKLAFVFLSTLIVTSCDNSDHKSGPKVLLDHIVLSGEYQTTFNQDDEFNYNGLIVTAYYSNSSYKEVSDYQVSSPNMSQIGEQDVVVTYKSCSESYTITVNQKSEDYEGYMFLEMYRIDIALNDNSRHYLNPGVKDKDGNPVDVSDFPFRFELTNSSIIAVSSAGGIYSKKASTGTCVVTCIYTENENITAKCTVNVLETLPVKEKAWKLVNDYSSLGEGDIITFAAPTYGYTASLDFSKSKINVVESTFSSDKSVITSLAPGSVEFYVGVEEVRGESYYVLEAQSGEYLVSTHQGKVKLDKSTNSNRFWDIHSNIDPETGEGSISDGAVIENNVTSLGYFMYNVSLRYFTTYVENTLRPGVMELPFIYRLEEI